MSEYSEKSTSRLASRALVWLEGLRTGLWPIPLAMTAVAVALFLGAMTLDAMEFDEAFLRKWHLHSGTGDDARNLLSTLAAAIITMSSLVFSITIVALSLAANQFGSRLVRTYMSDVRTKFSLGLFTMTIVYCLMALRSVGKDMPPEAVPHISVTLGLVLALMCVIALLIFLHSVGRAIVADEVIRRVARELDESIDELPALTSAPHVAPPRDLLPADFNERCDILRSRSRGYIEAVGHEGLTAICSEHDIYVRLDLRAGAYVCENGWLAFVYPKEKLTDELREALLEHILIGSNRTPTQDIEFTLRHFVDIALRALSPGINDSNTALVVIDHLSGAMARLMRKQLPSIAHIDSEGTTRLVAKPSDYAGVLGAALHQIRQSAATQPSVIIELLRSLGRIGEQVTLSEQRDALIEHAKLIAAAGIRTTQEPWDRTAIEVAYEKSRAKLESIPLSQ